MFTFCNPAVQVVNLVVQLLGLCLSFPFSVHYLCNDLKYQFIVQDLPKDVFISYDSVYAHCLVVFILFVYCVLIL